MWNLTSVSLTYLPIGDNLAKEKCWLSELEQQRWVLKKWILIVNDDIEQLPHLTFALCHPCQPDTESLPDLLLWEAALLGAGAVRLRLTISSSPACNFADLWFNILVECHLVEVLFFFFDWIKVVQLCCSCCILRALQCISNIRRRKTVVEMQRNVYSFIHFLNFGTTLKT